MAQRRNNTYIRNGYFVEIALRKIRQAGKKFDRHAKNMLTLGVINSAKKRPLLTQISLKTLHYNLSCVALDNYCLRTIIYICGRTIIWVSSNLPNYNLFIMTSLKNMLSHYSSTLTYYYSYWYCYRTNISFHLPFLKQQLVPYKVIFQLYVH